MRLLSLVIAIFAAACSATNPGNNNRDGGTFGITDGGHNGADGSPSGSDGAVTGSCGTCPSGYTCGSANGIAVCRAPSGVPLFSNVFVIVMENTSLATLQSDSASNSPYLHGLFKSAAYSSDYHGVTHPSAPNYLALISGSPGVQADGSPVACDCLPQGSTCMACTVTNTLLNSCNCEQNAQQLGDQIFAANKDWCAYAEDIGTACNLAATGNYVPRHVPFLYFQDVQMDSVHKCADHVVDYGKLSADLAGKTPDLVFIAPNLVDDMHGTSILTSHTTEIADGDKWLAANVPAITSSAAFKKAGILFIVWDEDDNSGIPNADDPIPLFVLSPLAKASGYPSPTHADHYALLATIEDGLALPRLGNATQAQPLADFFPAQ